METRLLQKPYREPVFQFGHLVSCYSRKQFDEYPPLGFCCKFFNKAWFCSRSAPNPSEIASAFNLVGKFGLKFFRMGADVIKIFNFPIASNWIFCKLKITSFFKNSLSGAITSAKFGINLPKELTICKNL